MIASSVVPPPPGSDEQPFEIGSTLTLFESAMIGGDRHPCSNFLTDGTVDDHFKFLAARIPPQPKSNERVDARRSLDIYYELINRIRDGKLVPVLRAYRPSGEIDPVRTVIRTSDLVALVRERNEHPLYLSGIAGLAPPSERAGPKARRGRKPLKLDRIKKQMQSELENGTITQSDLGAMLEKNLADRFNGSRGTVRKARDEVLALRVTISIPDNSGQMTISDNTSVGITGDYCAQTEQGPHATQRKS
jgi:hypothetical protein